MQISNFIEERVAPLSGALLGRAGEPAVLPPEKNVLFWSFPMSVPSLSW
eukprot:COSAG06_NODE_3090_length_5874_cov_116.796710_6_plen_49_part_00